MEGENNGTSVRGDEEGPTVVTLRSVKSGPASPKESAPESFGRTSSAVTSFDRTSAFESLPPSAAPVDELPEQARPLAARARDATARMAMQRLRIVKGPS